MPYRQFITIIALTISSSLYGMLISQQQPSSHTTSPTRLERSRSTQSQLVQSRSPFRSHTFSPPPTTPPPLRFIPEEKTTKPAAHEAHSKREDLENVWQPFILKIKLALSERPAIYPNLNQLAAKADSMPMNHEFQLTLRALASASQAIPIALYSLTELNDAIANQAVSAKLIANQLCKLAIYCLDHVAPRTLKKASVCNMPTVIQRYKHIVRRRPGAPLDEHIMRPLANRRHTQWLSYFLHTLEQNNAASSSSSNEEDEKEKLKDEVAKLLIKEKLEKEENEKLEKTITAIHTFLTKHKRASHKLSRSDNLRTKARRVYQDLKECCSEPTYNATHKAAYLQDVYTAALLNPVIINGVSDYVNKSVGAALWLLQRDADIAPRTFVQKFYGLYEGAAI